MVAKDIDLPDFERRLERAIEIWTAKQTLGKRSVRSKLEQAYRTIQALDERCLEQSAPAATSPR